jgi:hypothetical protein
MSAWLCNDAHISAVTQGLVQYELIEVDTAKIVAQSLLAENYRSLAARYGDPDNPHPCTLTMIEAPLDPIKLHMTTSAYQYQSCEHQEWRLSAAFQLTTQLLKAIEDNLGVTEPQMHDLWSKRRSTWTINDIKECLP